MAKRGFDITFALVGLLLLSPCFLAVWLLIKLDDSGPVFFWQTRIGKGGRPFNIIKFRTMVADSVSCGPSITASGDKRITRSGRLLRKTKIDELPQLWNVLRGEMSFVGPRPEVPRYVAFFTAEQKRVLELSPGITDEASIEFRDEEKLLAAASDPEKYYTSHCIPRKIAINLSYAKKANIIRDVGVILRTVAVVWLRR
jgi:lipopolysaccharide/colanic/teichoic acid biosynthesis glycosyltransferase